MGSGTARRGPGVTQFGSTSVSAAGDPFTRAQKSPALSRAWGSWGGLIDQGELELFSAALVIVLYRFAVGIPLVGGFGHSLQFFAHLTEN